MTLQRVLPPQMRRAMVRKQHEAADFRSGTEEQPQRIREGDEVIRAFLESLAQLIGDPKYQRFYVAMAPVEGQDATFTVGAVSQEFLPQRPTRQYLMIVNVGSNALRISFGHAVTSTSGIVLPANGFYEPIRPLSSSVNMLSTAGTTAAVVEG